MRVSSKPNLTPAMVMKRNDSPRQEVFPFNTGRCEYFYSARYALAAALDALKLAPQQSILMPSYNCWVEVEPVVRSGVKIDWYRVKTDFSIDEDDLLARIRPETAAIFAIHYLGFPQRLENIHRVCNERGIVLIEDCAHALLSSDGDIPLGSTGDMAIFSIRKTLPLPDGGCLLINNPALAFERQGESQPNSFATYYVLSEMLCSGSTDVAQEAGGLVRSACTLNLMVTRLARLGLRGVHKVLRDKGYYLVYPSGNTFKDEVRNWGMSRTSSAIINGAEFSDIRIRRRANFSYLLERLGSDERFELPIRFLPDGVCPLLFPVLVDERDRIYRELKERGYAGYDWWGGFHPAVPWDEFPEAVQLKQNVFGIPVHQSLREQHLDGMVQELKRQTERF
ncbi:aminotransferase class V-fold PLP-dependent enzyme [bacterium]|nr:aminotransferase class V-fold PLP-dependent enzyme [bacterium]